jgi:hypothetical protein
MNLAEYRRRKTITAEITLPSGLTVTVRRPPLQVWMMAGRIPQSFVKQILEGKGETPEELSPEDTMASIAFVRDAILYGVVSPRLVVGANPNSETELDPSELDPEDFLFLSRWIMTLSPDVPVATKGGEVSLESLNRFRRKRPGGGFVDAGIDSEQVREESEPTAGAAG